MIYNILTGNFGVLTTTSNEKEGLEGLRFIVENVW